MIVISDVHGCLKTLQALINKLPHNNLCFVGDLIDRGYNSATVVDLVRSENYKCVKGNHEDMMTQVIEEEDPREQDSLLQWWYGNGGDTTIKSYEEYGHNFKLCMESDLEWIKKLPLYIEYTNKKGQHFIISHSNINFAWNKKETNPKGFEQWALWSRYFDKEMYGENKIGSSINIIGHTPVPYVREQEELIFIDTGCVYSKDKGYGKLTAYDLETGEIYQQENIE